MKTATMLAALLLVLAGCGSSSGGEAGDEPVESPPKTRVQTVYDGCQEMLGSSPYSDVPGVEEPQDDGRTLVMNSSAGGMEGIGCVMAGLDVPASIVARMETTTSMMGELTDEADGLSYRWSYHPGNGLNVIITEA